MPAILITLILSNPEVKWLVSHSSSGLIRQMMTHLWECFTTFSVTDFTMPCCWSDHVMHGSSWLPGKTWRLLLHPEFAVWSNRLCCLTFCLSYWLIGCFLENIQTFALGDSLLIELRTISLQRFHDKLKTFANRFCAYVASSYYGLLVASYLSRNFNWINFVLISEG